MVKNQNTALAFSFRLDDLKKHIKRNEKLLNHEQNFMRKKFEEWGLSPNDTFQVDIRMLQRLINEPDLIAELVELANK
jgi:hypothetical protein